jgi:hypothetical protein
MFEAAIFGSLVGGIFRVIPEVIKVWDRKDERSHELRMQDKMLEFQKLKGDQRVEEITVQGQQDYNVSALSTLQEAIAAQGKLSGIRWIDAVSSSVRPVISYWFMGLYSTAKTAIFVSAVDAGNVWHEAIALSWTDSDMALWASILNFWFLGRVWDRVK